MPHPVKTAGVVTLVTLVCLALGMAHARASSAFVKGADIGWLSEMEAAGKRFYDSDGKAQDVLRTLKENGIGAVRLRLWVQPPAQAHGAAYSGIDDVLRQARRAKAAGMRLMIDFHYSDGWADPGKQTKPAAWRSYSQARLVEAVAAHTRDSLLMLRENGITPDWVQVGNETNNGMLWQSGGSTAGGRASTSMRQFAQLVNSGYDAVKTVLPDTQVIVHVSNCHDMQGLQFIYGGLRAHGGKFDIIAGSDYPTTHPPLGWRQVNAACAANMAALARQYRVPVMIAELGTPWDHPEAGAMVADIIGRMRAIPGQRGIGVFYWEPQAYGWKKYPMGAMDATGKPGPGLRAFRE